MLLATFLISVTFSWASVSNSVSYHLYEGAAPRQYTNFYNVTGLSASVSQTIPLPRFYAVTSVASNGVESAFSREVRIDYPLTNIVLRWIGTNISIQSAPTPFGAFTPKTNVTGTNAVAIRMNSSNEFFRATKTLTIERQRP